MRCQGCDHGSQGRRTAGFTLSAMAAVVIALLVLSCGEGAVEPAPPPPAPVATTVTVNPGSASFTALGETARFTAEVRDQNGQLMAGAAVAWASSDASVATTDASGLVTAAANGSATIAAMAGSVSGAAAVTVEQVVSAVAVSPSADTLVAFGDTVHLMAEAADANGHAVVTVTDFEWASSDTAVARVDDSGLVESRAEGVAAVTATASEVTGGSELTVVSALPTTIAVSPDIVRFTALRQTVQLAAEVREQAGRVMAGVVVSWSSGDTLVVVVDSVGLVTAVSEGTTTVTVAAGDVSTAVSVTVLQSAGSVVVSPSEGTVGVGDTLRLAAKAFDENGHRVDGAVFSWSSSDAGIARVDEAGLVEGVTEGTAKITATSGDASGVAEVTVENPDRAALVALYEATDGPNWIDNTNWLTDAPLGVWYGVDTDATGRVVRLDLSGRWDDETRETVRHGLNGEIPPELGGLAHVQSLDLGGNELTGAIPRELGELTNLRSLGLYTNLLTGGIPAEIGNLVNLERLNLSGGSLSGEIPVEIGNLVNLRGLFVNDNRLTGELPAKIGNLVNLRSLQMWRNRLTGEIPPELGNLNNVSSIYLGGNQLTGAIPSELGNLATLRTLSIGSNQLTGPIPSSFLQLSLTALRIGGNEGLCIPGTSVFLVWLRGIKHRDEHESLCNAVDLAVLNSLYELTGGPAWTESAGWLGDGGVEDWYGVTADSLGHVTMLDLGRNGLRGQLPAHMDGLAHMTELRMGGNGGLSGRLPLSLTRLSLRVLHYAETGLCAPGDASFQAWLANVESQEGTGSECPPLSDREILEGLYHVTGGPNWTRNENWLTEAPLSQWEGVNTDSDRVIGLNLQRNNLMGSLPTELGSLTRLKELYLSSNPGLTGRIPPELGNLTRLERLDVRFSNLTGSIPAELGRLSRLTYLNLWRNRVGGPIPGALGSLDNLTILALGENQLTGPIPPELGDLHKLQELLLVRNALTGPLPPELGKLSDLELLWLDQNDLSGPIPPELGRLARLRELGVANNTQMSGMLPESLSVLRALEALVTTGTGLCASGDNEFMAWLAGVRKRRVAMCDAGGASMAYLTQAVQSREFPVPLVAGERALLRVFPMARQATSEGIPEVRARFYLDGREVHVEDIPAATTPIPTEVYEDDLQKSANADIPGHIVQPGLEMVIEVDPDGTLDSALGVAKRIPSTGRAAVEVQTMPTLDLTLVPFLWAANPDSSILHLASAMAADPEKHEMLKDTRTLLPVGGLDVKAHEPVLTDHNEGLGLGELEAIRLMEGGSGHYMAFLSPRRELGGLGGGARGNRLSASLPSPATIAHELGHNMSLGHAPCGGPAGLDSGYPYPDGSSGSWGYDHESGGVLVRPSRPDLMSYCRPRWVSDYHFTNALRYRLVDEVPPSAMAAANVHRGLLLWGGIDADTVPYLEPAFVVDAPPALPDSAGDYRITGHTDAGGELFSLSFTMPKTVDGDGSSSFAFMLPVRAGWESNLAAITLTSPSGSFTLDGDSDLGMAILRNPRSGQVRGFLRGPSRAQAAMDTTGQSGAGLDVLFSRGIPDAAAWRR